jgi:hypothetical protein
MVDKYFSNFGSAQDFQKIVLVAANIVANYLLDRAVFVR